MESRPVDHVNPYTNQIFQEAIIRNDYAVVKLLLKYGIHPRRNERNRQGLTALQQSVLDGNGKLAIVLLESSADIEAKTSNGWTCLHIASALGDLDIVTTLINHCADLIALTKNEELPIDLAATREIKIKLAREMSRVGYSELAQWYMRKLAAREGAYYVLSTNTLLDLACDDHYDKSYSTAYPYYVRHYNENNDVFLRSPVKQSQNTAFWPKQESDTLKNRKDNLRLEVTEQENTSYLTYSSGYLNEAVLNHTSGEYTRMRNSTSVSSGESPKRKLSALTPDEIKSSRSMVSITETGADGDAPLRYGTLRKNKRNSQNMQRKPSKIELHIDYTNSTEDDDADDDDDDDDDDYDDRDIDGEREREKNQPVNVIKTTTRVTESGTYIISQPVTKSFKTYKEGEVLSSVQEQQKYPVPKHGNTEITQKTVSPLKQKTTSQVSDTFDYKELKSRNVRFKNLETSNEFCNCPNCKKMGYAFSPDIRASSRKVIHLGEPIVFSPEKQMPYGMVPASSYYHPHYYPATTIEKHMYFDTDRAYKPRKRKNKLISGIKSMFKDSIRVHRASSGQAPALDDAGILFSVSIRDRDKTNMIQQRHAVRKSNSFSGSRTDYVSDEVNVYPHNQVVPPPIHFSDSYIMTTNEEFYNGYPSFTDSSPQDFLNDSVFEGPNRSDYQINPQKFLGVYQQKNTPNNEEHSQKHFAENPKELNDLRFKNRQLEEYQGSHSIVSDPKINDDSY